MDTAAASGHDIVISPISLAEIVYLIEKNRLPSANVYADFQAVLEDPVRLVPSSGHGRKPPRCRLRSIETRE